MLMWNGNRFRRTLGTSQCKWMLDTKKGAEKVLLLSQRPNQFSPAGALKWYRRRCHLLEDQSPPSLITLYLRSNGKLDRRRASVVRCGMACPAPMHMLGNGLDAAVAQGRTAGALARPPHPRSLGKRSHPLDEQDGAGDGPL